MARGYDIEIIQVDTFDGDTYEGAEIEQEHLEEADQVFYTITYSGSGESFYRWVAGPFEDMDSLEATIEDDETFYRELAA